MMKLQVLASDLTNAYTAVTGTYTILSSDYTIDCTANTFTVTLPTSVGIEGKIYNVKNSGSGIITLEANGSQTIDGELNQTIYANEGITIQSNNSNWIII